MKKEMTEEQKYQRKKNILIILFMILLVVFVLIMCGIFIYSKLNPPQEFLSPDEIEIKQMQISERIPTTNPLYVTVSESTNFTVKENEEELKLILSASKEIKLLRNEAEESIKIMLNDRNINNNIKLIYQTQKDSLILTETGELYKLTDNQITDGQLKVGQILTNLQVKDIVNFIVATDSTHILNSENKIINIDTQKEYIGIIKEIQTPTSTIYIYEDNSFGLEEGKMFIDENNNILRIKLSFDNKIITIDDTIYEINTADNTISTSTLGEFRQAGYKIDPENNIYKITLLSNTGKYDFTSTYYHY